MNPLQMMAMGALMVLSRQQGGANLQAAAQRLDAITPGASKLLDVNTYSGTLPRYDVPVAVRIRDYLARLIGEGPARWIYSALVTDKYEAEAARREAESIFGRAVNPEVLAVIRDESVSRYDGKVAGVSMDTRQQLDEADAVTTELIRPILALGGPELVNAILHLFNLDHDHVRYVANKIAVQRARSHVIELNPPGI